jgi:hypothetical protein
MLELAYEVALTRNITKPEALAKISQGFHISALLQALDFSEYLTKETRERIWYCLIEVAEINDYPVAPVIGSVQPPSLLVGIKGDKGDTGSRGADGGATDFIYNGASITVVVDSFPITSAPAARWEYYIGGTAARTGEVKAHWASDGSEVQYTDFSTQDIGGSTDPIGLTVDFFNGDIRLLANISSGTWNIRGSRYWVPNQGAGVKIPTNLSFGKVYIGNASNVPSEQSITGDVTISPTGVSAIGTGVIVDSDISPTANVSVQKLESKTASKVAIYDINGKLDSSTLDADMLPFLEGLTGNVQEQIDNAATNITGAITPYVSSDAIPDRVVVSDPSGKLTTSAITSSQLSSLVWPIGAIMMWGKTLAEIPAGWHVCDGTNGTINMTDLFPVGAGSMYTLNQPGGANFVTLTTNQIPSHSHTINDPGHTHKNGAFDRLLQSNGTGTVGSTDNTPGEPQVTTSGIISTSTTGISINNTGGGQSHENRPPFRALYFIQRIS